MKPSPKFVNQSRPFWAYVRLVSEHVGYSERRTKNLRRYTEGDLLRCLEERGLSPSPIRQPSGKMTDLGVILLDYLNFRAESLERDVRPQLMNRAKAKTEFEALRRKYKNVTCSLPFNKQKRDKKHYAYLTCIVNILAKATLGDQEIEDSPRGLAVITTDSKPVQTLSRWMDGAFPSINNPKALWEVKEYYGTTTFGSRIADGVYETTLDGLELLDLQKDTGRKVEHYLMVDDYFTWWDCGRSYLCRIIDILHMGLVDEVLFGREVLSRWPQIVAGWKA